MDELDDDVTYHSRQPAVKHVSMVPLYAVLGISAAAIVAALIFRSFIPALITYAVALTLGCGLLFFHRKQSIAATRQAGGLGYVSLSFWDQFALAALVLACLANGLVIAFEMASWDWGF